MSRLQRLDSFHRSRQARDHGTGGASTTPTSERLGGALRLRVNAARNSRGMLTEAECSAEFLLRRGFARTGAALIREVSADLLLGNAMDVRDLRGLLYNRIDAVVDLAINESPSQLSHDMIYCRIPIIDGDGNRSGLIETAILCTLTLIGNRIRTMVACSGGMSRSPALAAVALALLTKRSPEDCLTEITSRAPHDVSPVLWSELKSAYNEIATSGN